MWIGDRISVEDNQELTTIVINPLRVKWKEILLMCWVAGFTFVGLFMIYLLATGFSSLNFKIPPTQEDLDSLVIYGIVFLGFWLYFEYKTVKSLMWYRYGKELLKIDNEGLWVKKSILTYGKSTRYFFENIKEFHQRKHEQTSFCCTQSPGHYQVNLSFEKGILFVLLFERCRNSIWLTGNLSKT